MKQISPYIDAGKKTIELCLQSDYENQISIEGAARFPSPAVLTIGRRMYCF